MRRFSSLLLHCIVVAGLALGTAPLGLSATVTSQPPGTVSVGAGAQQELASSRAKHKRERRQHDRKTDRKHDRKQQRKNQQRKRARQAQKLRTGVLPGANIIPTPPDEPIGVDDHYIVQLREGTGSERRAARAVASGLDGVVPTHVYQYVFSGFAAVIPPEQLAAVRADPRVEAVVPDQVVHINAQTLPTGVERIDTDENPTARIDGHDERVDVDVAVIDSAGNDSHPDLNIWAWGDCVPIRLNDRSDDLGHGTHVGGTIGALDNNIGVVGVAPGARLWNIRVVIDGFFGGFSRDSWIICGLDLVTRYATDQGDGYGDIEVANVSLGHSGRDSNCATDPNDLFHQAFCRVAAAGVTVAVAAGNESRDAALDVPAAYDEVLTVSALADSNGQAGGAGRDTTAGADDTLATFSNFGADVDLAAPGVDILSTVPTGSCLYCRPSGYRFLSGTSMATPHVAGAAALYLATHPGATPAQVKAALLAARETIQLPGDPDGIDEGVLNVGPGSGIGTAAEPETSSAPDAVATEATSSASDTGQRGTRHGKAKRSPRHHRSRNGR